MFPRVITFAIDKTISSLQALVKINLVLYVALVIQAHAMVLGGPLGPLGIHGGKDVANVTAKAGTHLRLKCGVVVEPGGTCQWTKDGFGLGLDEDVPGWPRYSMLDCDLHVEPVLTQDEGVYVCQVGGIQGRSPRAATPVRVNVVSEPGTPHIHQGREEDVITVAEGRQVELSCESGGGNPAAEIMWTSTHVNDNIENVDIDVTHIIDRIEPSKDGRSFKTLSTLKFVPKKSVSVRCSAFSEEFQHPKTSEPLEIRLKTKPSVKMIFDKVNIVEGDSIQIQCADGNSQEDLIYNWFVNNLEMEGFKENVLELNPVTRRQNNAQIKCVVSNSVGRTEMIRTLEVKFSPSIISQPLSQNVDLGETVALNCEAEANPTPKYIWIERESGKLVGRGENLSLVASVETEGQYLCKAYSDGFLSVTSSPAIVTVKSQPKVSAELVSYGNIGKDVVLKCKVHSSSELTNVLWTKNEDPIEAKSTKYQMVQAIKDNNLIQSDLLILKLSEEDFGEYGCFASNEIGTDYITMSVKKEEASSYSAIIMYVNILVGSLVLLTLFIFYRHRKLMRERKQVKKGVIHPIYRSTVMPLNKKEDSGLLDKLLLENVKDISEKTCEINMALDSSFRKKYFPF